MNSELWCAGNVLKLLPLYHLSQRWVVLWRFRVNMLLHPANYLCLQGKLSSDWRTGTCVLILFLAVEVWQLKFHVGRLRQRKVFGLLSWAKDVAAVTMAITWLRLADTVSCQCSLNFGTCLAWIVPQPWLHLPGVNSRRSREPDGTTDECGICQEQDLCLLETESLCKCNISEKTWILYFLPVCPKLFL